MYGRDRERADRQVVGEARWQAGGQAGGQADGQAGGQAGGQVFDGRVGRIGKRSRIGEPREGENVCQWVGRHVGEGTVWWALRSGVQTGGREVRLNASGGTS